MMKYTSKTNDLISISIAISVIIFWQGDDGEITLKMGLYTIFSMVVMFIILMPLYQSLKARKNWSDIDAMHKYSLQNTAGFSKISDEWSEKIGKFNTSRIALTQQYENLEKKLTSDIYDRGTSYKQIYEIYQEVDNFQKSLIMNTDNLVSLMPNDINSMSEFGDKELFFDFLEHLQSEMASLKQISENMTECIEKWMVYHTIEVSQEKDKFENTIKIGNDKISASLLLLNNLSQKLLAEGNNGHIAETLKRVKL